MLKRRPPKAASLNFADLFSDPKTKAFVTKYDRLIRVLTRISKIDRINDRIHADLTPGSSWSKWLTDMQIAYNLHCEANAAIPEAGPAILIANHPFGMLDGFLLGTILHNVRDDIKIMANKSLCSVKNLAVDIIGVNPYEHPEAIKDNLKALRESRQWLNNGGLLSVFPAGDVANKHENSTLDLPWHPTLLRFIAKSKCPIIPMFIAGTNSPSFYKIRKYNERLGSLQLGREFLKKRGKTIEIYLGNAIAHDELPDREHIEEFLRDRLFNLEKHT